MPRRSVREPFSNFVLSGASPQMPVKILRRPHAPRAKAAQGGAKTGCFGLRSRRSQLGTRVAYRGRMNEGSAVTRQSISFLRVLSEREEQRPGHVACPRRGGSVPLAECAHCPRFVKVTPGAAAGEEMVHCHAGSCAPATTNRPLSLPRAAVADLMTRNVVCVRSDLTLDAVTTLFLETSLSAVPVVDGEGHLLGFLGQDEVTLAVQVNGRSDRPLTVADILLPFALAVPETTSLTQAAAVMAFEGQQRLAVTSSEGVIVGVLAASDILYWLARADGHVLPPPRTVGRP